MLGLPPEPVDAGNFDLVVVGGGYAGMGAAISGARLGCKVALLQDRPVLGGNSASIQPSVAAAAAKCVVQKALTARLLADSALPALKPNQPTQSNAAPIKLSTTLWGAIGIRP